MDGNVLVCPGSQMSFVKHAYSLAQKLGAPKTLLLSIALNTHWQFYGLRVNWFAEVVSKPRSGGVSPLKVS
jgi:hypothetical protein